MPCRCQGSLIRFEQMNNIAHIFRDRVPHLSGPIVRWIDSENYFYYLRDQNLYADRNQAEKCNADFIEAVGPGKYLGYLKASWWVRCSWCRGYVRYLFEVFWPEFALASILKLLKGPRNIVVHGDALHFPMMLLLALFRKKVVYINWGCPPHIGRLKGWVDKLSLRMNCWIFVLMSPEIRYFKPFMGERVSTLPYSNGLNNIDLVDVVVNRKCQSTRKLILGNSTILRDVYGEILDRLNPDDWEQITCMLNYGREDEEMKTDAFVAKYEAKFGKKFFAWRKTLPYEEYKKVMGESAIYICPTATQMGLGAVFTSILQGKTILLRGDNYNWLRDLGVGVCNLDSITDFSYEGLRKIVLNDVDARNNLDAFKCNFRNRYTVSFWREQIKCCFGRA